MVLNGSPTPTERTSPRRGVRRLAAAVAMPATFVGAALLTAPTAHADVPAGPGSLTVHYSDGAVVWTVPAGTYEVSITAVGGSGADGNSDNSATAGLGGYGAVVSATVPVLPGERLHLEPGSAGHSPSGGSGTGPIAAGGAGNAGSSTNGGGGGAGTVVRSDSVVLATAGGGGGGGGTGYQAVASGGSLGFAPVAGGDGGDAGSSGSAGAGAPSGAGGNGSVPAGSGPLGVGAPGHIGADNTGGAGGGGGGLDGMSNGGGVGGTTGAGGGGGAGGPSFAVDPSASVGVASTLGDGWVTISWAPGLSPTSTLSAPVSVPQGTPVTLTDVVAPPRNGLPTPTGSVTFEQLDQTTGSTTVLGQAPVSDGRATLVAPLAGTGSQAVQALYSGDSTYFPSTSDYAFTTVVPALTVLSATPDPVAFGNVTVGASVTRTVTITNTGGTEWSFGAADSDDPAVSVTMHGCATLAPGATCTATVAFAPTAAGALGATLTLAGTTGTTALTVTGNGVAAKPVVTRISPNHGPRAGGTLVTITGRNLTGVTAIKIGSASMTSVTCSSSTTCTALTPRGTSTRAIRVTTAAGTSALTRADRFTYR